MYWYLLAMATEREEYELKQYWRYYNNNIATLSMFCGAEPDRWQTFINDLYIAVKLMAVMS
jgi:hypothetical protein